MFAENDPNTPVSFAMQYQFGQLGLAYTTEEHRQNGLYSVVKNELTRAALAAGFVTPSVERLETSPPPRTESGYVRSGYRIKYFELNVLHHSRYCIRTGISQKSFILVTIVFY